MVFQGDILIFCDFIQVFAFTTNHHLKIFFLSFFFFFFFVLFFNMLRIEFPDYKPYKFVFFYTFFSARYKLILNSEKHLICIRLGLGI